MAVSPKVSIIIRSKNEEKWISSCLKAVFVQSYDNFEVIIVDNASTDKTVEKAAEFDVDILNYDQAPFLPGHAINEGIRASSGELLVILSAHCIPVNEHWLANLVKSFDNAEVAGVYGRQEPLAFTNDLDKRDLINIFGLDRKVQRKDPFFHNANSIIRRDVWEQIPFDETAAHIEDRIWAQQVLDKGYHIVYEPEASVFHYHGINQGRNVARAKGVVRILEQIHCPNGECHFDGLSVVAIIPSRGEPRHLGGVPLLQNAIASAKESKYVTQVVVTTDNKRTMKLAADFGAVVVERPAPLSAEMVGLAQVYSHSIECLAEKEIHPDLVVTLEEIYPFRPAGFIDRLVEGIMQGGYDSVIAACPEYGSIWREEEGALARLDQGWIPTKLKQPLFRGLFGLGCVTHPRLLLEKRKIGDRVGLVKVEDQFSRVILKSDDDYAIAEALFSKWLEFRGNKR